MRKSLMIALGLAALFGLTACIEKQEINVNPSFNPVTNEVNTTFYFNISASANASDPNTKQLDSSVQAHGNFRGIDNATLFAIIDSTMTPDTAMAKRKMYKPVYANAMRDLSSVLSKEAIATGQTGGTRVVEINLPLGTNKLVFYAKAARESKTGLDSKELYGSLDYTTTSENYMDLEGAIGSFAERRLAKSDSSAYTVIQNIIVNAFNGIFQAAIRIDGDQDTLWYEHKQTGKVGYNGDSIAIFNMHWADYACAGTDDHPVSPYFKKTGGAPDDAKSLEQILGKAYTAFSSQKYSDVVRSGSGSSTARTLSDLYTIVKAGADATPTNIPEAVAQLLFKKLQWMIEDLSSPVAGSLTAQRSWKAASTVKNIVGLSSESIAAKWDLNAFPEQMHLPQGSQTLGLDQLIEITPSPVPGGTTRILQLKYNSAMDTLFHGSTSSGNVYTYTPELCYYGNSSIRTNKSDNLTNQNYPNHANWYNSQSWSGSSWLEDGTAITSETRGIALTNTIQYGVALLGSKLKLMSDNLTDNGAALVGQQKTYKLDDSHYLEWTGILVGGQPEQVGWDYLLRKSGNVIAGSNAIVYDKINYRVSDKSGKDTCGIAVTGAGYLGGADEDDEAGAFTNYTLLYDNVNPYTTSDSQQGSVYVALEFVNHLGQDFWGEQGLIEDGATFYLFAKLVPSPVTTQTEKFWDDVFKEGGYNNRYLLPPYDNNGVTRPIRRVFVQDIKTSVVFRFMADGLKHAYIAVPDLRSAKISLGMDVNLNWTAGLTYEAELGQR